MKIEETKNTKKKVTKKPTKKVEVIRRTDKER